MSVTAGCCYGSSERWTDARVGRESGEQRVVDTPEYEERECETNPLFQVRVFVNPPRTPIHHAHSYAITESLGEIRVGTRSRDQSSSVLMIAGAASAVPTANAVSGAVTIAGTRVEATLPRQR